ncbi:MAG: RDD family protein, partial [Wolbachia pipientis]|nr:RDD family protein [Wolbachia pipientis]
MMSKFSKNISIIYICINCSYFTYFISSSAQATSGQQLVNIHTMSLDGAKIGLNLAFDKFL